MARPETWPALSSCVPCPMHKPLCDTNSTTETGLVAKAETSLTSKEPPERRLQPGLAPGLAAHIGKQQQSTVPSLNRLRYKAWPKAQRGEQPQPLQQPIAIRGGS